MANQSLPAEEKTGTGRKEDAFESRLKSLADLARQPKAANTPALFRSQRERREG